MNESEIIATLALFYGWWLTSSIKGVSNSIKELTEYLKERDKQ
ncbi:hypothetical protein [Carnobacterium sp. FSL E2-0243]